jgi:hypothetical protein
MEGPSSGDVLCPIKRPVTIRVDADVLAWLNRRDAVTGRGSTSCCVKQWKGSGAGRIYRCKVKTRTLCEATPKGCGTQTLRYDQGLVTR